MGVMSTQKTGFDFLAITSLEHRNNWILFFGY